VLSIVRGPAASTSRERYAFAHARCSAASLLNWAAVRSSGVTSSDHGELDARPTERAEAHPKTNSKPNAGTSFTTIICVTILFNVLDTRQSFEAQDKVGDARLAYSTASVRQFR
jgi:hypothetical protein